MVTIKSIVFATFDIDDATHTFVDINQGNCQFTANILKELDIVRIVQNVAAEI